MIYDQNTTLDILHVTCSGCADGRGLYSSSPKTFTLKFNTLMLVMSQIGD